MKHWTSSLLVPVFLISVLSGPALSQGVPFGVWISEEGKSRIEVFDCENRVCGKIVWLLDPLEEDGTPKLDVHNENEALRNRPLIGLPLVVDFVTDGLRKWKDGLIYNPLDGKTYQSTMELVSPSTLKVRGYVLLPIFGKSQIWTRYAP